MIAKAQRHRNAEALEAFLLEMYESGQRDAHEGARLIAAARGPGSRDTGSEPAEDQDISRLTTWLKEPLAHLDEHGPRQQVWHCTVRADPHDRALSDSEWTHVAADILHRTGLAPQGDSEAVRWIALRHGTDHMHIVATLARQDGAPTHISSNHALIRNACHDAESRYRLHSTRQAGRPEAPRSPALTSPSRLACLAFPTPPGIRALEDTATANRRGAGTGPSQNRRTERKRS
jgi:hypothetical protein